MTDVSTHSRPKAAGWIVQRRHAFIPSFNTQPPEGGWSTVCRAARAVERFNTQPPEGGWVLYVVGKCEGKVSTHSRPKAAGIGNGGAPLIKLKFQHTAARRRLGAGKD